jgi:hypothetical protein
MYYVSEYVHDMWQNQPGHDHHMDGSFKKKLFTTLKIVCLHTSIICYQMINTECNQWGNTIIWYSSRWFYLAIFCKQNIREEISHLHACVKKSTPNTKEKYQYKYIHTILNRNCVQIKVWNWYIYMGPSPNYGRNSNILIPDPYH